MAKRRVVVTGMGAVTPIGLSVDEFWQSIKAQKTGFSEITKFDTTNYKCKLAAEVKEFDAKNYMDAKEARRMELFSQYAVAAAKEAIEDAGLEMDQEDPYMAGCAIGSGVGSLQAIEREHTRLIEKGPGRVGPLFVPMMISNMAAGNVSIHFGLKGKSINVVTACATGTNTIGEAFRAIQYGEADIMVSGGTEGSICPTAIAGFTSLTALTAETDPKRCSIPFDKERSGFVMGEGAAVVVLEELEHAKRRGAKIYAEVVGYGCSSDAYHITSPAEDGSGAARAMLNAVQDAGITDYNELVIDYAGVKLSDLMLALVSNHPNYFTTAVLNGEGLGAAHYPELCYAWLASMDSNYVGTTANRLNNGGFRIIRINCEVDVKVFDAEQNKIASIINEQSDETGSYIAGVDNNGQKYVVLPVDETFYVEMTAREKDSVNYSINEYSALAGEYTRNINYFNIEMEKGEVVEGVLPAYDKAELEKDTPEGSDADYRLYDADGNTINSDSDLSGDDARNV